MNIKRLVLGTAAGALAVTGAQAADLPVVVEPVDYVRICDAFGTGFYYIPGTETCLRVAGRIRADYNAFFNLDDDDFDVLGDAYGVDGGNGYRFRARAYIYMDSRTNTEFGLLRTFTEVYFTSQYGGSLSTTLNRAFIQFGGLTFGRTQSFFDFLDASYSAAQFFNANLSDVTTNVLAYTFAFGNGFSASISLEDSLSRRTDIGFGIYQGSRIPDIVGNIRVDQGWGSAQLMAAGHYVEDIVTGDEEYGFAVGGGVNVNVPFGTGTQVGIQGGYAHGALLYTSESLVGPGVVDAIVDGAGNLELANSFNVSGGFSTSFTPTISLAMQAGYAWVDQKEVAGVSYDFSNLDIQGFLGYSPVSGFVLGVGAEFKYVDTDDFGSGSALSTFFRAQRTF
ncbi:porin [Acuticoccus kandeliae]|uniref:porin n=1 Tax=Acuticoccus kandeliae TaxID=2073160 RepID=UPI000D3E16B3|nr:porin [Acuticoccus kandeliae]